MKKNLKVVTGIVAATFGLALIVLGLAPAVKSAYRSICRIQQAKQLSEGVGKKKAEEVIDTLYLHSETAEPVVEQTAYNTESDDIGMVPPTSLLPEWITAEYGPGDYYYHAEVADGDPEVVFSSYSEDRPDFIQVVSSEDVDGSRQSLSVDGIYELRILLSHDSDTVLENVDLTTAPCLLTDTRLRFVVEITYGDSTVVYAEEFAIEDGDDQLYTVSDLGLVSFFAPNQKQTLLTRMIFSRNLFGKAKSDEVRDGETTMDAAILPGGAENLYEISIPFEFVAVPEKESERCSR